MPIDVFKLSFTVQLAVASGYLAYLIAYAGIRQHHTSADALLRSFAFGLIASAVMTYGYQSRIFTPLAAFVLTIGSGMLWRWLLMGWWRTMVRKTGVSWSDDIPTAWLNVTATNTQFSPSQIIVETNEGRLLMCENTRLFGDAHEGPAVFGLNGDVALYVTSECRPDGTWIAKEDVRHASEGDLITYIPASQIKRVELRYLSAKAAKAAARAREAAAAAASA